ncbi:MAG: TIGR02186 family protein [Thiohalorhabdus sp.]|uniref:TIGR02186 family protein n=1 Tax=Thiohalorhabdus sp. TaxID=3094134 RepID=UPI00397FFD21
MRMLGAILGMTMLAAAGGAGAELVTDVSDDRVSVTYRYEGEELLLFGSLPEGAEGVLIEVRGPEEAQNVSRKGKVAGLWMNVESQRFEGVPGFYALLSDATLEGELDKQQRAELGVGPEALFRQARWERDGQEVAAEEYFQGLLDHMRRVGLFQERPGSVAVREGRLFRAAVDLPAQTPVGEYEIVARALKDGEVTHREVQRLSVAKVGIEKWLYNLAHDHPATYGILAVLVALFAGWFVGMVTRGEAEH